MRDAGKAAEGKPEPFQIAEHSPHKSDGLALFALAHGKFVDGKADGIVRARRDDDIAVAARRDRRHDVAGDRGDQNFAAVVVGMVAHDLRPTREEKKYAGASPNCSLKSAVRRPLRESASVP